MVSEWVKAGGVVALAASGVAAGSLSDELADVVGLLVPVVAPLLLALAGAVSILKTLFDARRDRGSQRSSSEEMVREDLMRELVDQRAEIKLLRGELGEARREIREMAAQHARDISGWQDRYSKLLDEVGRLRADVNGRGA